MATSLRDRIGAPASSRARHPARAAALAASMIVSACACQPAPGDAAGEGIGASAKERPTVPETAEDGPAMDPPALAPASVPPDLLTSALEDAARRTAAKVAEIEVTVAEAVTWPDGSMGCPQPGMMYTQALVPGYRIVLRAGGHTLHYHASSRGGGPNFCPPDRVAPPAPGREEAM